MHFLLFVNYLSIATIIILVKNKLTHYPFSTAPLKKSYETIYYVYYIINNGVILLLIRFYNNIN